MNGLISLHFLCKRFQETFSCSYKRDAFNGKICIRYKRVGACAIKVKQGRYINSTRKQSEPHTSTKAMLFARWQHHLRF